MSINRYDFTKEYKVGDLCWEENLLGYPHPDGTYQKITFVCKKYHEAYLVAPYAKPFMVSIFPSEKDYRRTTELHYWEAVYPEWSSSDIYREGDFCQYKGRYYVLTWRMFQNGSDKNAVYMGRILPNQPPNELEDEEGVRPWAALNERLSDPSFSLAPFNLELQFNNEPKDIKCPHPYGYRHDPYSGEMGLPWFYGVGTGARRNGFSYELFREYPVDVRTVYDDEGHPEEVTYWPGGTTAAGRCGCAFQHNGAGIFYGGNIYSVDKTADPPVTNEWVWNGGVEPSPDGATPASPASTPSWMATGHLFYSFNHPLFFRRSVKATVGVMEATRYWKAVWSVPDVWHPQKVLLGYALLERRTHHPITKTFIPKDDCFDAASVNAGYSVQLLDYNDIGSFNHPTTDMTFANGYYFQKETPYAWPTLLIEGND
jgi:hypothetical protein